MKKQPLVSWPWRRVHDHALIYAREINFNDVLAFELAAYPLSMFNTDGKMNVFTSQSTIKHTLQATVSEHNCPISHTMIMMCLHFSGLSPRRLANCVSTWTPLMALPHVTISSTISSTFHRRRWNIVDIVDDEPATRNDNVNDADVK